MKRIVQIELTNHCNRKCSYCGQSNMTMPKAYMELQVVERCIDVLLNLGQMTDVGLNHYGESLLHPGFIFILRMMNDKGINPWLYTNGDSLSDHLIESISKLKLSTLVISAHIAKVKRMELYRRCVEAGINTFWQEDYTPNNLLSIANQVGEGCDSKNPILEDPTNHCKFLRDQCAIVLSNGDLVPCCCDYDGKGVFGNIMDKDAINLNPKEFILCKQCPGHPTNIV